MSALRVAALDLYRQLGNRLGEAEALTQINIVQRLTGDYAAATASLARALELHRDLGSRAGEASALNRLGVAQYLADGHRPPFTPPQNANHPRRGRECLPISAVLDGWRLLGDHRLRRAD